MALNSVQVRTILGDDSIAIQELDQLIGMDSGPHLAFVEIDPMWDPLRNHPEFTAMLERHR